MIKFNKTLAAIVSTAVVLAPMQAKGLENISPPFDICTNAQIQENCIASFEVKLPGSETFESLARSSYSSEGTIFTLNSSYTPSFGGNRFKVIATTFDNGPLLGGTALNNVTIINPDGGMDSNGGSQVGIDPNLTFKIKINVGKVFPGPALALINEGNYTFSSVESGHQLTIETKPLSYLAYGSSTCLTCNSEVSSYERIGHFAISFMPRSNISQAGFTQDASFNSELAWFVVESNAADFNRPSWIDNAMYVRLSAPHLRADGATLNAGRYRVVMNDAFLESQLGITRAQFLAGGISAATAEVGTSLQAIGTTNTSLSEEFVSLKFSDFHYSSRDMVIKPNSGLVATKVNWTGKKATAKRNKSLSVNVGISSGKRKPSGEYSVQIVNSAGVVVAAKQAVVKKGKGKVTFSKAVTKSLVPGAYKIKIKFKGTGNFKTSNKEYPLRIK
jgi:hypothetical protein